MVKSRKGIAATISSLIVAALIIAPTMVITATQDTGLSSDLQKNLLIEESAYAPILNASIAQVDLSHIQPCGNASGTASGNGTASGFDYSYSSAWSKTPSGVKVQTDLNESGPKGTFPTATRSFSKVYQVAGSCMSLFVPLYMAPGPDWAELIQLAKNSSVPIIAVVNPDNGPGDASNPAFAQGIAQLQAAGILVFAYVDTARTTASMLSVEGAINLYVAWYHVSGVFLDDVVSSPSYYSGITAYDDSLNLTTIGNPGTVMPPTFLGAVPILNIFEGDSLPSPALLQFASLPGFRSALQYSIITTSIQNLPNESYFQQIAPFVRYVWVSSTDASYSSLPNLMYLQTEIQEIGAA